MQRNPIDERARQLAEIVVDYSVRLKPQDVLLLRYETAFSDFAGVIEAAAFQRGANVVTHFVNLADERRLIERNDKAELEAVSKEYCRLAEMCTASIRIDATSDPHYLKGVDPAKIADEARIVGKPFFDRIIGNGKEFKGVKWNLVGYPCEAEAREAGMTMQEYTDFIYSASIQDWKKTKEKMLHIKSVFDNASEVRIVVPDRTDLRLSLSDRWGQIAAGTFNMPDGEVYYGPVEDSAEGKIYFPYPALQNGNEVQGISLEYSKGEVTRFSAEKNQGFLEAMLKLEGMKRIGELGIGCNYGIQRYMKNLLFDEKIGGTVHIAVGFSYPEPLDNGGGNNKGEDHWDLVCDLRRNSANPGGALYVDGVLVQSDGRWTF